MRVGLVRALSALRARLGADLRDDAGASPVEFVLVGTLLTVLTLGVLQFGLAVYVRNVVHDAAVEGAYHAALADTTLADGAQRTRDIVGRAIGAEYATEVRVQESAALGQRTVEVRVQATLPLVGLLGAPRGMEVTAHAPVESFD
ncbi:Flp pilus assembly protein TadG [Microbacterium trichothecenolyticum]|nr:TadE/TadG family type IV pilus assembly protein [Microbacterium trichothecenolyticum]MDR7113864.1 Flp pilus assembly protein TadG [Microbacterium trichothecenolyticum]